MLYILEYLSDCFRSFRWTPKRELTFKEVHDDSSVL